jgi:hypothetical protein
MNKIHITKGSAKMEGIDSINTSTLENEYCTKMRKTDAICEDCYAARFEKLRPNITVAFRRNNFLSEKHLNGYEIPKINARAFRFSSYGELINYKHAYNYFTIARNNPDTTFTLWTKRHRLVQKVLKNTDKPSNLLLIYSSPEKNKISPLPYLFDKVFTAFTKNEATDINCHGKCMDCLLCYSHNDVRFINEIIK